MTPRHSLQKPSAVKYILPIALIFILIALDQWIKVYVKNAFVYGEVRNVFGNWFKLYFIENNGMAFGQEWGGVIGKYLLTGFRIAVSCFGAWYLWQNIRKSAPIGLLIGIALIMAGAVGNIIDSVFYGVIFDKINAYQGGWFRGQVVDMFYAPILHGTFPGWFPIWKNEPFVFFSPIWNLADACITVGVSIIIVGQKRFFAHAKNQPQQTSSEEPETEISTDPAEEISAPSDSEIS